jgi:hypothetical protein
MFQSTATFQLTLVLGSLQIKSIRTVGPFIVANDEK